MTLLNQYDSFRMENIWWSCDKCLKLDNQKEGIVVTKHEGRDLHHLTVGVKPITYLQGSLFCPERIQELWLSDRVPEEGAHQQHRQLTLQEYIAMCVHVQLKEKTCFSRSWVLFPDIRLCTHLSLSPSPQHLFGHLSRMEMSLISFRVANWF